METPLPADFKEFLRLLNSKGARYLLVGGYAVALHGYLRSTGDMDIWVDTDVDDVLHTMGLQAHQNRAGGHPFDGAGQRGRKSLPACGSRSPHVRHDRI